MKLSHDRAIEFRGNSMCGNGTERRFFVKLHSARHLHYDFRLEHAGVLMSWVIPYGPCLDPTKRREAELVDDHEVRYGSVERVIPAGQYGAGPVLLWDQGTWQPCQQDVDQAIYDGRLKFQLRGHKLNGAWSLNRKQAQSDVREKHWLLIKEQDEEARSLSEMDIVVEKPMSVLTGRTLAEVAADPGRVVSSRLDSQGTARSRRNRPPPDQRSLPFDDPEP